MPNWEEYFQFLSRKQVEQLAIDFWNELMVVKAGNDKLTIQLKEKERP